MTAGKNEDRLGVLYISYDGMLEPLGASQVLAYLERLSGDYRIHLLSFEKPEDWADAGRRAATRARIERAGIAWTPRRYHRSPSAPATAFDIAAGALAAIRIARRERIAVVHARSYVAGMMALAVKHATGARFLFDIRGFWVDERVDGGLWPRGGRMYRVGKAIERRLFGAADAIVSLTEAGAEAIRGFAWFDRPDVPIAVIPTCADLDRFVPAVPPPEPFCLGYVGSVGTWYLFDEALAAFAALQRQMPDARLLIVNRGDHAFIRERLAAAAIDTGAVELVAADHAAMPGLVARMHGGLVLIKPRFSKVASAPTKLGELLGAGVPCLVNDRIGDMAAIVREGAAGVVVDDFGAPALEAAMARFVAVARDPETPARCRATALRHFSLEGGVAAYAGLYDRLVRPRRI